MPTDLTDSIVEAATKPKKAEGDAGSIEARPISEMIEADKYAKSQAAAAANRPLGGIRFTKVIPPGTV